MKNKFQKLVLILTACLCVFSGCSDDKSDFAGNDCYFVSFSLTVDGVAYPAKIVENKILLEIPYGIDLAEATVDYKLNENATVLPDPASIKNWNADQLFRIQSYSNTFNSFTYSVSVTDVETTGNVVLLTQADVDAFADKNINSIDGNLIIGEKISSVDNEDVIKNLDGLSDLAYVNYNVVINNSFGGENLEGLSNLKRAGGLYIGSTTNLANPKERIDISFPKLESIGNLIVNSDSVVKISFPQIKTASEIYIKSQFLENLELTSLQNCYGNLTVNGTNNSLDALLLPNLSKVSGNMSLNNLRKLSVVGIAALKEVEGNFEVKSLTSLELINFPLLSRVSGNFAITGNTAMTKIVASEVTSVKSLEISSGSMYSLNLKDVILSKLSVVQDGLSLLYLGGEKLELPILENIGGAFVLQTATYLQSFAAPKLAACKSMRLTGVNQLKSMDFSQVKKLEKIEVYSCAALEKLFLPKVITGDVTISSSGNTESFVDFGNLETIEGTLNIDGFTKPNLPVKKIKKVGTFSFIKWNRYIETISFPAIEECGDFNIGNLDIAKSLSIPSLKQTKSFSITECPLLLNVKVPLLKKIDGELKLQGSYWDGYVITNLNDFSTLTSVGSVTIESAPLLSDFTGLKNVVKGMTPDNWTISDCKYNPTLQDMLDGKYTE